MLGRSTGRCLCQRAAQEGNLRPAVWGWGKVDFPPTPASPGKHTSYINPGINQYTNLMMKNTVNKSWRRRRRGDVAGVPAARGLRGCIGKGDLFRVDGGWPYAQGTKRAVALSGASCDTGSCRASDQLPPHLWRRPWCLGSWYVRGDALRSGSHCRAGAADVPRSAAPVCMRRRRLGPCCYHWLDSLTCGHTRSTLGVRPPPPRLVLAAFLNLLVAHGAACHTGRTG